MFIHEQPHFPSPNRPRQAGIAPQDPTSREREQQNRIRVYPAPCRKSGGSNPEETMKLLAIAIIILAGIAIGNNLPFDIENILRMTLP